MHQLVTLPILLLLFANSVVWGQNDIGAESTVYQVDADSADIRVLIYRAGALSGLGHNHVIAVGQLEGKIYVSPDPEGSRFELTIPVQGLVVDDSRLRREEGDEFSTVPSEGDIVGTRRNMLGKRVLNAEQYPLIKLAGTGPRDDGSGLMLGLAIELLGRVVELEVPVALQLEGDSIEASGAFRLSHSELGMRPFTALLGALRVADEMDVKYRIRGYTRSR